MSLYTVTTGGNIQAADINQLVNDLQQPSGGSEVQTSILIIQGAYQTSATVGGWIKSNSQGSTPVSASTGTTTLTGVGSLTTSNLSISGVNVNAGATGASNTARFITTVTFQY